MRTFISKYRNDIYTVYLALDELCGMKDKNLSSVGGWSSRIVITTKTEDNNSVHTY